jgi:pilus assembly protein CpaC
MFKASAKTTVAALAIAAALGVGDAADAQQAGAQRIGVAVGKSQIVRSERPFSEIVLPAPEMADVRVLTNRSFYIYGKKPGVTNVMLLDAGKQPVGMVDVDVGFDVEGLRTMYTQLMPAEKVEAYNTPTGVLLRGRVSSAVAAQEAVAIAERFAPNAVTNSMTVRGPQQVMLEVRFIEASRRVGRELGFDTLIEGGGDAFAILTGQGLPGVLGDALSSGNIGFGSIGYESMSPSQRIQVELDALEESGVVRTLARPNLAALSGDTASFLAGGEFPIPVAEDNNRVTIEFKEFGVGLSFTPTVLSSGQINLKVQSEVSQLDPNFTIRTERIEIPGLQVRRAGTTLELRDGQSFAMAGLLQSTYTNSKKQVPWAGDVPVLGALFRSARFERGETELVVIVTPRLVDPDARPALSDPLSRRAAPNDFELFGLGRLEKPAQNAPQVAPIQPAAPASPPAAPQTVAPPVTRPTASLEPVPPQRRRVADWFRGPNAVRDEQAPGALLPISAVDLSCVDADAADNACTGVSQ